MNTRYMIVEKERGVFLGMYSVFALFAKNEKFGITKAFCFENKEDAVTYIKEVLNDGEDMEFDVVVVECKDKYIGVLEIIKQGYGKYTHRMLENVPMISTQVH